MATKFDCASPEVYLCLILSVFFEMSSSTSLCPRNFFFDIPILAEEGHEVSSTQSLVLYLYKKKKNWTTYNGYNC